MKRLAAIALLASGVLFGQAALASSDKYAVVETNINVVGVSRLDVVAVFTKGTAAHGGSYAVLPSHMRTTNGQPNRPWEADSVGVWDGEKITSTFRCIGLANNEIKPGQTLYISGKIALLHGLEHDDLSCVVKNN